jgi:hypothetical protein
MIKFTLKVVLAILLIISSNVFAGYITSDLTKDTYISHSGYDWTWAAPINTTNYEGLNSENEWVMNVFEDASVHTGWMFIEGAELELLFSQLTLADFQINGLVIQSVAYWNSEFTHVDIFDFLNKSGVKSADGGVFDYYETFYVRASVASVDVPEPSTLMSFTLGLIALVSKKKLLS